MWQHNNNPPPNVTVKHRGSYTSICLHGMLKGNFLFSYTAFDLKCNATEDATGGDSLQAGRMQPDF